MQAWRRYFEGDLAEGLEDSIIDVLRIASLVESHVEKRMQSAYDRALEENGRGMDGRQKVSVVLTDAQHILTFCAGCCSSTYRRS